MFNSKHLILTTVISGEYNKSLVISKSAYNLFLKSAWLNLMQIIEPSACKVRTKRFIAEASFTW